MSYVCNVSGQYISTFVPTITYEVTPDNQSVAVGDTITVTATIPVVAVELVVQGNTMVLDQLTINAGVSAEGYTTTQKAKSYTDTPYANPYRRFTVMAGAQTVDAPTIGTLTKTFTVTLTDSVLAGLVNETGSLNIGFNVGYRVYNKAAPSTKTTFATNAYMTAGLVISKAGYAMPTLTSMGYADTASSDPLTVVGNYVKGVSTVQLTIAKANITASYKGGTPSYCKLVVAKPDGTTKQYSGSISSSASISFAPTGGADQSGTYSWTLQIEDSYGVVGVTTGSYTVLAYSPPALTFGVARYSEIIGDETTYEESDDGEHVWLNIAAVTSPLNGHNAWTLSLTYDPNDNGGTLPMTILSGSDGATVTRTDDRTLVTGIFSSGNDYSFTATLTDQFGTYEATAYIYKADGYFDVEKTGVAVGMRSTGEPTDRKFEVAEDYTSHFYGGIAGVSTYPLLASGATATDEELTGGKWIDGKPIYRVVMKRTLTLAANTAFGTMPAYETIVSCRCLVNFGTNTKPIPFCYYNNDNWELNWTIQDDGDIVIQAGSSHRISGTVYFIIEYTKTTD